MIHDTEVWHQCLCLLRATLDRSRKYLWSLIKRWVFFILLGNSLSTKCFNYLSSVRQKTSHIQNSKYKLFLCLFNHLIALLHHSFRLRSSDALWDCRSVIFHYFRKHSSTFPGKVFWTVLDVRGFHLTNQWQDNIFLKKLESSFTYFVLLFQLFLGTVRREMSDKRKRKTK